MVGGGWDPWVCPDQVSCDLDRCLSLSGLFPLWHMDGMGLLDCSGLPLIGDISLLSFFPQAGRYLSLGEGGAVGVWVVSSLCSQPDKVSHSR